MRRLVVVLLLGLQGGCGGDPQNGTSREAAAGFPLNLGTMWSLSSGEYSLSLHVDTILNVGASTCVRIQELSRRGAEEPIRRTIFFTEDAKGNIARWWLRRPSATPSSSDSVGTWYRFDAQTGASWFVKGNALFDHREIHLFQITLESRSDTVTTALVKYFPCFRFFIDDLGGSGTEYYDWVAPGIGLVKRRFGEDDSHAFVLQSLEAP